METEKDPQLWRIAKKRVAFRSHLVTYLLVNGFLWMLWLFTKDASEQDTLPWPLWSTLGWGIGVAFDYFSAYHSQGGKAVEKEYEKLKGQL